MTKDPYRYFRVEARELVEGLTQGILDLERGSGTAESVGRLLRLAHTLKGAARVVKLPAIAELAHGVEEALASRRGGGPSLSKAEGSALLRLVDEISAKVRALDPASAAPAPSSVVPLAEERFDTLRVDSHDVDSLLRGVTEASVRVGAVRRSLASFDDVSELVALLADHLAARPHENGHAPALALGRARPVVEELRVAVERARRSLAADMERVELELSELSGVTHRLRLVPAQTIFSALDRVARDASQALGKSVELETSGGDVRLDANVLGALRVALMHTVRNAVVHGIEEESVRLASGKPRASAVRVTFERRGKRVFVVCEDDGRGIDVEAVRGVAVARNLLEPDKAVALTSDQVVELLLRGGISTAREVTELAGRGIGLDVVRATAAKLNGVARLRSSPGRGATVEIQVPVSIASLDCLVVESAGQIAAIPLDSVRETLRLRATDIAQSVERSSIIRDGRVIPFLPLDSALRIERAPTRRVRATWSAVVIETPRGCVAVGVDRLLGTSGIVTRPLPDSARADALVSGASFDGDGNPQLVLDPDALVAAGVAGLVPSSDTPPPSRAPVLIVDDSLTTRMLEQSILESAGYAVELAVSAEDALEKARERRYSLFVVDVEMPGMDGFDFVARTRADPGLRDTPAILVTSRAAVEDRRRGEQVGARAYIVKSDFDQRVLLENIRQAIG